MPSYTLRVALLLAPTVALQLPFSVLIVILERITRSLFLSHTTRDYFRSGARGFTVPGNDLTIDDDNAPTLAFLGVSVLGVLLSCFCAAGMWELRRVDGIRGAGQRVWCWSVLAMQVVVLGVSVGVLGWTSALQAAQEDVKLGSGKEYTRETWVCGIGKLYTEEQDWAGSACGTAVREPLPRVAGEDVKLTENRKRHGSCSFLWPSQRFWPWSLCGSQRSKGVVRAGFFVGKATMEAFRAYTKWARHRSTNTPRRSSIPHSKPILSSLGHSLCMQHHRKVSSQVHTSLRRKCRRVARLLESSPFSDRKDLFDDRARIFQICSSM
jgi:hypothetical protein